MSLVTDFHLTVTRPECVTTPHLTFPLLIILITFFFLFIFSLVYLCEFYKNLDFPFPNGISSLSFNLGVSHSWFSPDMSYSQIL